MSGKNLVKQQKGIRVDDISNNLPVYPHTVGMSAEEQNQSSVSVTPYEVNMESSVYEFSNHVSEVNINFRETVIKKVSAIKLKDTDQLNKKIEELKI